MQTLDTPTRQFIDMRGGRPGLTHMPGLDGLRGLAVAGVVAYHAGFDRMVGGFLGVSTFFTLSGFLITSLLLAETRTSGTVDLRRFWSRRFRRLLPASTALLALVVLFGFTVATPGQRLGLRADVLSSLFQVANWRFVFAGTSYGAMFEAPSPVLHFWSLAIEEQFYWLFPPLLLLVVKLVKGRGAAIGAVLGAAALASWSVALLAELEPDRAYFGTDTRAVEILLGGVLAVLFSHRGVRRELSLRSGWRTALLAAGGVCLAVQLWWWVTVPQSAPWLYDGGLGLYALMSCVVIAAAALPTGPMRSVMSTGVLRWAGERSYGIYLIHWPLFLLVRQELPDLSKWVQTALVVAATLGLAEVSYRFFEQPIRSGRWPARGTGHKLALPAVAIVALVALIPVTVPDEERPIDFEEALEEFESRVPSTTLPPPTAPPTQPDGTVPPTSAPVDGTTPPSTAPPLPVPKLATYGDSTALLMGMGMDAFMRESGAFTWVPGNVELGCAVSRFEAMRVEHEAPVRDECTDWPEEWSRLISEHRPDIVQLITGVWEITDARIPGGSRISAVGEDPEVDAFVRSEMIEAVDTLSSAGGLVVLVLWPPDTSDDRREGFGWEQRNPPERMERFHEILRDVAAARPDSARIVDLASWFGDRATDRKWRDDGRHIEQEEASVVYREWLGPQILATWQEWRRERDGGGG